MFEQDLNTYEYNLYETGAGEIQLIPAKNDKCVENPPITEGHIITVKNSAFNLILPWSQEETNAKERQTIIEGDHVGFLQEEDEIERDSITKGSLNGKLVTIFSSSIDQAIKLAETLTLSTLLRLNFAEITLHRAPAKFRPEFLGSIAQTD